MKRMVYAALLFCVVVAGCSSQSSNATTEEAKAALQQTNAEEKEAASSKPGDGKGTEVVLSPKNVKIEFVGNHSGDDPKPRKGSFSAFSGKANLNEGALKSLNVEIETNSLRTEIDKLTNHLKSPDFFDVRQHPKATFASTAIEADGEQKVKITGDLTLLGVTKSISFPASVSTRDGLSLKAEFNVDRTRFGMNYGEGQVEKEVEMTITVGG